MAHPIKNPQSMLFCPRCNNDLELIAVTGSGNKYKCTGLSCGKVWKIEQIDEKEWEEYD